MCKYCSCLQRDAILCPTSLSLTHFALACIEHCVRLAHPRCVRERVREREWERESESERERERESARERARAHACALEWELERQRVCVCACARFVCERAMKKDTHPRCMCVWERERARVCGRERERERVCVCQRERCVWERNEYTQTQNIPSRTPKDHRMPYLIGYFPQKSPIISGSVAERECKKRQTSTRMDLFLSKETYSYSKRHIHFKRDLLMSEETYLYQKRNSHY